jgi:cytochrome c biogenesis protein CcmG, thiol:disulfide interchange protein DsbE
MIRFLAIFLILVACAPAQSLFGRRAPGFALPDSTLKYYDLQDFRGKVVLIDFMRTDCPKCQEVTKILEQAKAKFGDRIQILSVVNDRIDNAGTVKKYVAGNSATSPFLFDCGQMMAAYLQLTPQNPTVHFPHVVVVDKAGMIRRDLSEDAATLQNITSAVEPLLK